MSSVSARSGVPLPSDTVLPRAIPRWRVRPRFAAALLAAAVLLGAVVFGEGARKIATGPASGTALRPSRSSDPRATLAGAKVAPAATFRVGTYNIDGACGLDGKVDVHRTAGTIAGCDLVALNEVHGRTMRDARDQAQLLGDELAMPSLYLPVERRWWHDDFGNGLICSLPVTHWARWPLSPNGASSNRNVSLVTVTVEARPVRVLITHLGRHEERTGELSQVLDLFQSLAEPAILLGDLNTPESDPVLKQFLLTPQVTDVIGQHLPGEQRHGHNDWILVRGLECSAAGVTPKGASDHPFYWADLSLPHPH